MRSSNLASVVRRKAEANEMSPTSSDDSSEHCGRPKKATTIAAVTIN